MKKFCRIFWDVDKQQAWLEKMSDSGFELVAKKGPVFHFKECDNNFVYKIELLPRLLSAEKLDEFKNNGVEVVFSDMRRICLKKRAEDGVFDPFSDAAERFRNFRLKAGIFFFLFAAAFCLGIIYFGISVYYFQYYDTLFYMISGALMLAASAFFLVRLLITNASAKRYRRKYNNRS